MRSSQYRPFGHLKPLYTSISLPYLLKRVTKHVLSFIMFCGPICDEIPLCACVLQFCIVCTIKYTNNAFSKGIGSMHSCLTGVHAIFNNFQLVGFFFPQSLLCACVVVNVAHFVTYHSKQAFMLFVLLCCLKKGY